jgi:putative transposase
MPNYRRAIQPGGTFFLTLVTEQRMPIFAADNARLMLHNAIDRCRKFHPFELGAIVVLVRAGLVLPMQRPRCERNAV